MLKKRFVVSIVSFTTRFFNKVIAPTGSTTEKEHSSILNIPKANVGIRQIRFAMMKS